MDLVPKTVTVIVPVNIPELRGRHATTKPNGVVTSFRAPKQTIETVDLAISRLDPAMSRGLFMRLAAFNLAVSINQHYEEIRRQSSEVTKHADE